MGLESTEGVFPMIGASAAVSISIEGGVSVATVGDDNSGTPEGTDGEEAGVGATASSAMDSSEESVEGILDDLDGRDIRDGNRARKYGNNLLAREAMRSI